MMANYIAADADEGIDVAELILDALGGEELEGASPTRWPKVSLIVLNLSKSRRRYPTRVWWRAALRRAGSEAVFERMRLARPVRASWETRWVSWRAWRRGVRCRR